MYNSDNFDIGVLKKIILKAFKLNPEHPMTIILSSVLLIEYNASEDQVMVAVSFIIGLLKKEITPAEKSLALKVMNMAKLAAHNEQDKIIIDAVIGSYK
jgi:hypothetical protein